jgi:aminomethyltransferase
VDLKSRRGTVGRDARPAEEKGVPRTLIGFEMVDRGIARHGYPVFVSGAPSDTVTSGSFAPFLKKNMGWLCPGRVLGAGSGRDEIGVAV